MNYFILCVRLRGYSLMGPFPSRRAAIDHTDQPTFNVPDDPRWQIVCLAPGQITPAIIPPGPMPIDPHTTYEDTSS